MYLKTRAPAGRAVDAAVLSFFDRTRMPEFLKDIQALTGSKAGDDADSTFSARLCADILEMLEDYKTEGILTKKGRTV